MKPFIIITGPQAVGKMATGITLKEKYNYRLFHNHMSIELVVDIFGELNKNNKPLVNQIRELFFDNIVNQDLEGFVFTFTWAFNIEEDHLYVKDLVDKFEKNDWKVIIVELEAKLDTRLQRNRTELRLENKPTKRDFEWSENDILRSVDRYRLNSNEGEITHPMYLRINNDGLALSEVADMIHHYINEVVD